MRTAVRTRRRSRARVVLFSSCRPCQLTTLPPLPRSRLSSRGSEVASKMKAGEVAARRDGSAEKGGQDEDRNAHQTSIPGTVHSRRLTMSSLEKVLDGQEKVLDGDHPTTLSSVNNMANVYRRQGDCGKEPQWYRRTLGGLEKALGSDHPDTLVTVVNMATVYYGQSDYAKALQWFQRALDGQEKVLGSDHPDTLDTVANMATVYYGQSDYEKALLFFQRACDGRKKVYGDEHALTKKAALAVAETERIIAGDVASTSVWTRDLRSNSNIFKRRGSERAPSNPEHGSDRYKQNSLSSFNYYRPQ